MRIELVTIHTPDLHAVMALPGTHGLRRDERQKKNLLLTIRLASSMLTNGVSPHTCFGLNKGRICEKTLHFITGSFTRTLCIQKCQSNIDYIQMFLCSILDFFGLG